MLVVPPYLYGRNVRCQKPNAVGENMDCSRQRSVLEDIDVMLVDVLPAVNKLVHPIGEVRIFREEVGELSWLAPLEGDLELVDRSHNAG